MMRFLFLLALLCMALPAHSATDDKLREIETKLAVEKQQEQALAQAASEAARTLGDLRQRMIDSTKTLQEKEGEQEALEEKLDTLTEQIAEKSKNAAQKRADLSAMVAALVEIASRPPESLFLQDRVTADHVHRSLLLQAILPRLKQQAESTAKDLFLLYDLQEKFAEQKRLVAAAQSNLQKQQAALDQMIATRQGFLKRTEEQKAETARHLAALSAEAKDLRQLMEKVAPSKPRKNISKNAIGLKWPVAGAIRKSFGDKDADGVISEGLTFAAPSGAPIVAPLAGRVVFAGPFRGYGQILILQHDNGYHSFLSGFGRIDADMKQEVSAGEPLGVLPVKAGAKPELYFEWRRGDEPVDPMGGLEKKGV